MCTFECVDSDINISYQASASREKQQTSVITAAENTAVQKLLKQVLDSN